MTMSQVHELTWGALALDAPITPDTTWLIKTTTDTAFGNPVPLVEEIQSLLTDGSLAVVTGYNNREVTVRVRVSGANGDILAQAEAAFMAEALAENPSPLVWTPATLDARPVVFDVVHAHVDRDYDGNWGLDEKLRLHRYYVLTLTCLPWVRDAETTVIEAIEAPASPGTPAVYETISAISGTSDWSPVVCHAGHWTGVAEDSGTDAGNTWYRVSGTNTYSNGIGFIAALRGTSTSLAGFPFLTVDAIMDLDSFYMNVSDPDATRPYLRVYVNGVNHDAVASVSLPGTGGARRYYFSGLPDTIAALRVDAWWPVTGPNATPRHLKLFEIGRTDRIEIDGSNGLQVARTAVVTGSAPTQAAVRLDAGANPLVGSTAMIYTGQSAVIPLRGLVDSSAAVTSDTAMISGAKNTLATPMVFLVPTAQLTDAWYSLLARLNFTGEKTVGWQARVVAADGSDIPGSDLVVAGETLLTNDSADPWRIHALAEVPLPPIKVEGDVTHAVEVTLTGDSGVTVDEGWLLDTEHGAVTVIHEPSAFQLTAIELRSPQLDAPRPQVVGTWEDYGAQDITRLVDAFGTHLFRPGTLHVFTATDIAKYAPCELEYYPRYHSHPGPAADGDVA